MNILLINHYAGSPVRGMEFRPWLMAREWQKLGHTVTIVAADFTHLRSQNFEVPRSFTEVDVDGVPYVVLKTPRYHGNNAGRGRNIASFCLQLSAHAGRVARTYRPDAVIASSTYPVDIYAASKIARKAGARLYFELHDLWPLTPMVMGNLPWWNPIILILQGGENAAFARSNKIISILPDADRYIRERGYDVGKFVYIPNGVVREEENTAPAEPVPQVETLRALRADGWFLVGYTGNHSVANALETFIDAAVMLRDVRVKLVLVGKGNHKDALTARAAGAENVLFLDPVPKTAMGALLAELNAAYMGLAKSRLFDYGVSPNKLFDYMLAAKPVIYAVESSNNPVRDADCGLTVPVGSPRAVADAVRTLMAMDAPVRRQMGENGRAYVRRNHDYPTLAKRFLAALQD
ncbi:glycosyl transferase group 1 [Ethanoligenens harbinense YUAN-3]|uniref:Glycosyl transferase group 1 n=2 Tax=Ethanoligenens harbinense TaxID=253239 RepID=E6U9X9_ETHHY|nr:glycosyl transferase group 1 [Ethanoligenens harbinense YUAN-3]AVQ95381.1 glycosyltransferase WbuB [Ethanoligenens harbinense YUAN-3]AYF38046.1 glycosyltransferase WbuB [Ethanoligenens harbinense]AYF40791.1 glycosyltransferase WbuB [Ethanoligenens harbinense]QCN91622.1 glycosyltransferase WbuB [Ethanoligenens harbinense]